MNEVLAIIKSRKMVVLTALFFLLNGFSRQDERPNIILIMADDMGYECLGCNGSTEYKTPNLDRLASEGIRFTNCYSQPLCTPSRVKIMTGQHNFRNYEYFGYLNPNQKTFGNLLQENGYATCIAGKWQLNGLNRGQANSDDRNRPHHFGFDEYCLWQLNHPKKKGERFANPMISQNGIDLPRDENAYGPDVFCKYIEEFIERKAGQPFFVYYPMVLVHGPFVPTPDSPQWKNPENRYKNDTAYFADMMAYTDKVVNKIEKKLKSEGVWENTLFIFTADNGTYKSIISETKNGKIRGAKGLSINTGHHVPFVASWPAKNKRPSVFNGLIDFSDIFPSLADAAKVNLKGVHVDGDSFIDVLSGDVAKIKDEIFIHYSPRWGKWKNSRWVLDGKYKLYQNGKFYNCQTDPLEKSPLIELSEKEKIIKERFKKELDLKEKEFPFAWNDTIFQPKIIKY